MSKYTFRTKTETYYNGHLVKKGQFVKADKELSEKYPDIFDLVGAENDVKPLEEDAKGEKPAKTEQETQYAQEEKAEEDFSERKKPTNSTVDNMTRKELLDLAEVLHIEGASKMNVGQLKRACKEVLGSK